MNLLHQLANLLGHHQPAGQTALQGAQQPQPLRTQQQVRGAPFKMYEDNSFEGNPAAFQKANPNFKFYEDNTFSEPDMSFGQPNTQQQPSALQTLLQGGQYNPGFTPLQNSGQGGPGYSANLQPTPYNQGPQNLGHKNPQLKDLGYFYNQ